MRIFELDICVSLPDECEKVSSHVEEYFKNMGCFTSALLMMPSSFALKLWSLFPVQSEKEMCIRDSFQTLTIVLFG